MKDMTSTLLLVVLASTLATMSIAATIGIDVGLVGNPLPSPGEIVQLLKSRSVTSVRIYDARADVLREFVNQGIRVSVTVPNDILLQVANSQSFATGWVRDFVTPYVNTIDRIVVGNEWLHNGAHDPSKLLPAMQRIHNAVTELGLNKRITTAHAYDVVDGYPPSAGSFKNAAIMGPILAFLKSTDSAIMVNIYPYFTYAANAGVIDINYALGNAGARGITDKGRTYQNLMDAQVDTVLSAMSKLGYGDVRFIIGETGWPSAGGAYASVENARVYNQNLVRRALGGFGSPLRPGVNFATYIFALFNENGKGGPAIERNFGLYYPNKTPVYPINLSV